MSYDDAENIVQKLRQNFQVLVRYLHGEPNPRLSSRKTWCYGRRGSLKVEVDGAKRGVWYDNEDVVGGGPIQFIQYIRGCSVADAFAFARDWLRLDGARRPAPSSATS